MMFNANCNIFICHIENDLFVFFIITCFVRICFAAVAFWLLVYVYFVRCFASGLKRKMLTIRTIGHAYYLIVLALNSILLFFVKLKFSCATSCPRMALISNQARKLSSYHACKARLNLGELRIETRDKMRSEPRRMSSCVEEGHPSFILKRSFSFPASLIGNF